MMILGLLLIIFLAYLGGKLISKIKMPAILGWLIVGMIFGPYGVGLISPETVNARWFHILMEVLECNVGLFIGTELVLKEIKKSGKQILVITLTQSLGAFFVVTLFFGILFFTLGLPIYLAAIFGGIALATAPAPALSVVREFKTKGPVTSTLIPLAALDDVVAVVVFLSVISVVATQMAATKPPLYMIVLIILLPLVIGVATGYVASEFLKKDRPKNQTVAILLSFLVLASAIGILVNEFLLPSPIINFMLLGMAFSATFSNRVSLERLADIKVAFGPILGFSMLMVIVNLGATLDYHLILGAGWFTLFYILSRAAGKFSGAYIGAKITKAPETVRKYLGFTLLPHSGVSLVFTGIAVSVLSRSDVQSAQIIQGTIAAAAVINEIIAVFLAKKGFEWAGEMNGGNKAAIQNEVEG